MAAAGAFARGERFGIAADPAWSPTLPGWAYTDPDVFEAEREAIHYRSWHYAGALEELAEPGDYITARILDESVIVIRGAEGGLHGFYNVCQHRAHELLRGRGNTRVITCPYHAWVYQTDGRLKSARGAQKLPGFVADELSLKPIAVEVLANRYVFFNLDCAAQPLAEQAGDLARELETEIAGFADLRLIKGTGASGEMRTNWKAAVDNYLECYHCRPAHPAFADLVHMDGYRIDVKPFWSSQKGTLGRLDNTAYPVGSNAPEQRALFWWLWPTTTFNVMPGNAGVSVFSFMPGGVDRTISWGQRFGVPGVPTDRPQMAYRNEVLNSEDVALCESVQRGLSSRGYRAGRFVADDRSGEMTEAAVHQFHRMVAAALDRAPA